MTSKKIISAIAGFLVAALIYFVVYMIIGFSDFTLFSETLEEKERMDAIYFFTSLSLLIGTILFMIRQFKSNRRFVSIGVAVALVPLLYVFIGVTSMYCNDLFYYQPFDKAVWANAKPFNMAKTLYKQNALVGQSRKAVIEKLGYEKETKRGDRTNLDFAIGNNWIFTIDIKNDTVIATQLHEPFFDL
jgi:uncharacterized membrane protein YuzA (DUF378 family)